MATSPEYFNSSLRPYDSVHGRYYDFREFEVLGETFMSAVANAFVKYSSTLSTETARAYFCIAVSFFRWLCENERQLHALVWSLRTRHIDARKSDWESAIALWRTSVIGHDKSHKSRKYNLIRGMNAVLGKLFVFGVLPRFDLVSAPANLREARPTKTLAEVSAERQSANPLLKKTLSKATETGTELEVKRDFLSALVDETGRLPGDPTDHARELMKINNDRLTAVRNCAERDFKKWRDWWAEGQQIIQQSDLSFTEIDCALRKYGMASNLFPSNNRALSLSRLLTYLANHPRYGGRVLWVGARRMPYRIASEVYRQGGCELIQARLFPHKEFAHAVMVMVLCDTGSNPSVARTLRQDCLSTSDSFNNKTITGNKMRAGGKLIINDLPIKDPLHDVGSIEAIDSYLTMSRPMRVLASDKAAKSLFLSVSNKGVAPISLPVWVRLFRDFRKRHKEISHLPVLAKMIRPSVLLQANFDKESGIVASSAIGDHNWLSTTNSYVARYPTKIIWERMIREFQALFQAVSIVPIEGAAKKLGLSANYVRKLFGQACRTGLGVACLNPKGGIQPGSRKGETCTQLQKCYGCPNRIVVATPENLCDLILWNRHLEKNRPEWEVSRPEKWGKDWLPWLVFTQVVIESAKRGRTASVFREAVGIADAMTRRQQVNLPPLW